MGDLAYALGTVTILPPNGAWFVHGTDYDDYPLALFGDDCRPADTQTNVAGARSCSGRSARTGKRFVMADLSIDERDPNYFYAARQQKRYSIMRHTRFLETEEPLATVIATYDNGETWHNVCTCDPDDAYEIADALNMANGH